MNALLLIPLLSLGLQSKNSITLTVNAKPNEVITGDRTFRVIAASKNPVTQVEFYVAGDLRDTDTSTPYEFKLDTITEGDGPVKLTFKAYTSEGESSEKSISVTIDNGLSKGAPFHVQKGLDLLTDSKFAEAISEGRIAQKIDPKSNGARIVMARGKLGLGILDDAQRYVEDAVAQDPSDRSAYDLLAFIDLKKAFQMVARPDVGIKETQKAIADSIAAGIAARRKSVDLGVDAVGSPTSTNLVAYADAAIAAKRYSLVQIALSQVVETSPSRLDLAKRLAFALVREGEYRKAMNVLLNTKRQTPLDAYSSALLSITYAELGDGTKTDEAMKNAMLGGLTDPAVRTAQAYLALKFTRTASDSHVDLTLNYDLSPENAEKRKGKEVFAQLAQDLGSSPVHTPEIDYYLGALANRVGDYPLGQSMFVKSVLSEPINYDAYIEQGNKSLLLAQTSKFAQADIDQLYENAKSMFMAAIAARDDSSEALTGLAVVALFQNDASAALKWSSAAAAANPTYASALVSKAIANRKAAAAAHRQADQTRSAGKDVSLVPGDRIDLENKARELEVLAGKYELADRTALTAAQKLDPQISGLEITTPKQVWRYFAVGGRRPVIPAPR